MDLIRLGKRLLMLPLAAKHVLMPGRPYSGAIELTPTEDEIAANLRRHVEQLAQTIGIRHYERAGSLNAAADYIEAQFWQSGYQPSVQNFSYPGGIGKNVIVERGKTGKLLVIGAHYDTVPNSPGANDNASGVAVMLEMARILSTAQLSQRIQLVAFDNEEHCAQQWEDTGSHHYAQNLKARGEQLIGMWSLETLGYYNQRPQSQKFPPPLDLFYPDKGNFLAFVGNTDSRELVRQTIRLFRAEHAGFPAQGIAAPPKFRDTERSDHRSFWQVGYPALMVTDTANFRYPHYHTPDDTIDKVDFSSMARITRLLAGVASSLTA